jgi:integrase
MRPKSQTDTIEILSRDELRSFFAAIKTKDAKGKRDKAIFLAAYHFMLRASEVGLLRKADADLESHRLKIRRLKGGRGGTFEMDPSLVKALKSYLRTRDDDSPILFLSRNRNPISRRMLDLLMKQYGEAAGIPQAKCHFHALRHTGVTHWLEATGGNRPLVQSRAGHARPDSTDVYTHFTDAYRDEVSREAYASGKLLIL